mmetsp:Transcript_16508/g.47880  ORF Transcript_16508/g.47880 Transcript_16508/m.47880 type:complete len:227 (+) Transcript_16508:251-931(+)
MADDDLEDVLGLGRRSARPAQRGRRRLRGRGRQRLRCLALLLGSVFLRFLGGAFLCPLLLLCDFLVVNVPVHVPPEGVLGAGAFLPQHGVEENLLVGARNRRLPLGERRVRRMKRHIRAQILGDDLGCLPCPEDVAGPNAGKLDLDGPAGVLLQHLPHHRLQPEAEQAGLLLAKSGQSFLVRLHVILAMPDKEQVPSSPLRFHLLFALLRRRRGATIPIRLPLSLP